VLDTTYYYCQQANYNVVALTEDDGDIVEKVLYDPYGEATVWLAGNDGNWGTGDDVFQSTSSLDNSYLFQGRRWDSEADLYYFRNRSYSPRLGRFLQRDPTGYADGMNLYEMVKGSPIALSDPLGLLLPPVPIVIGDPEEMLNPNYRPPKKRSSADTVTKFVNCDGEPDGLKLTAAQKAAIRRQVSEDCGMLRAALKHLKQNQDFPARLDPTKKAIFKNTRKKLSKLLEEAIEEACDPGVDIQCECKCETGVAAWTRGGLWGSWANIHLCPEFFDKNYDGQRESILHEMTHYGGADDGESGEEWKNAHTLDGAIFHINERYESNE